MMDSIKTRILGNSGFKVSEVSFGCMSLSSDQNLNNHLLRIAFDNGINFFDTADLYHKGRNEESVGIAIKPFRQQVFLATKAGNQWRKDGSGWDWNPTKKYILEAVELSLKRLQTDYIDLYQLHGGTIDDPINETIEAFELLKEQGKIRAYGISSIRPNVIRKWIQRSNLSSVMLQYSLLDRRPEEELIHLLGENNIGILARGTLAKGMLMNKEAKDYLGYSKEEIKEIQQRINPSATALSYALKNKTITSTVVGIRTEAQLQTLIKNYPYQQSPAELLEIEQHLKEQQYHLHR